MAEIESPSRVSIRANFLRSINIREDLASTETISSYILTPELQELAETIVRSITDPRGSRAWALTGPYGSGKSAFGLFLVDVLCATNPVHDRTLELRSNAGWSGRLRPVVVAGHRANLSSTLLAGLADAVRELDASCAERVEQALGVTPTDRVWEFFEDAITLVKAHGYDGLFVIVDEFGKFLEHAVLHPDSEDLIVLQYLAEEGDRRPGEFLLMTLLHSAFADYLPAGSRVLRAEWQKIQGRFRDVVFTTSLNQHLTLLSSAIRNDLGPEVQRAYAALVDEVMSLEGIRRVRTTGVYAELLRGCNPLHPLTALLTWPIFRSKMAQNERSLFSFLASYEYKGFSWFNERQNWEQRDLPVYRLSDLYDYIVHALGSAVAFGEFSTRWSEIADALDRIDASAPELTAEVVKTIGLLNLYGSTVGLDATPEVLRVAVGDATAVEQALRYLNEKKLVVFRRYTGSYRLWEGSDVDLDQEYERAKHRLGDRSLAERLSDLVELRPMVARKHYVEKGTLRIFDVRVLDGSVDAVQSLIEEGPPADADGLIAYVFSRSEADRRQLVDLACRLTANAEGKRQLVVLAFPGQVAGLEDAVRELETWVWIRKHDPRVESDRVARQELQARIDHYRDRVGQLAGRLIGLRGYRHEPQASEWVHSGRLKTFASAKDFSKWLSALCDKVFHACPVIPNELINRRHLSAAAVAARRNLMEAMLERPYEANLGFTGGAAEATMYHAILAKSGLHKRVGDRGFFDSPNDEWMPVWNAIQAFVTDTADGPKPVTDLYERLAHPPFGIRSGIVPVLLLAYLLKHRHEVALYEENVYVPGVRIEVMERLTRQPHLFSLRSFRVNPEHAVLLEQVSRIPLFSRGRDDDEHGSDRIVAIVEPLVRFVSSLRPYAKVTKRFRDTRVADVRLAIQRATDPYALVFEDFPKVLGVDLRADDGPQQFAELLGTAVVELENAYPNLLLEIENELYAAFGLEQRGEEALRALRQQAEPIKQWASEPRLKRFVLELGRRSLSDWREGIGRVVMDGLAPSHWNDTHLPQFRARMRLLAGDFMRLRELAAQHDLEAGGQVLRISLLDGAFEEARVVAKVPAELEERLDALVNELRKVLQSNPDATVPELRRAALARVLVSEIGGDAHE